MPTYYILVLSMTHKNPLDFEISRFCQLLLMTSRCSISRIILSKQDAVTATNHSSTNIRMLASIFLVYAFLTSYGAGVAQQRYHLFDGYFDNDCKYFFNLFAFKNSKSSVKLSSKIKFTSMQVL